MTSHLLQTKPVSLDDLEPYKGKWVALRNRRVVASASELSTLSQTQGVKETDEFVFVPSESSGIYIL